MIGFIQEIVNVAEKYSLSVSSIDTTDITLLARLELFPAIYIQVYRNIQKNKTIIFIDHNKPVCTDKVYLLAVLNAVFPITGKTELFTF